MGTRKFRLLMSKYGFSIAIILIELFVVFAVILYMSQIAPIVWGNSCISGQCSNRYSHCQSFHVS